MLKLIKDAQGFGSVGPYPIEGFGLWLSKGLGHTTQIHTSLLCVVVPYFLTHFLGFCLVACHENVCFVYLSPNQGA